MNDPVHTYDDIIRHGKAEYAGYRNSRMYYRIKVYGPADSPRSNARSPYDLPTFYTFPVNPVNHINLDPVMDASWFSEDITAALKANTLSVMPGGIQANKGRGPVSY